MTYCNPSSLILTFVRAFRCAVCAACLIGFSGDPADAQESVRTTGGGSFEIVAGQIVRGGGDQRVPATLKNVVDELLVRFTDANVVLAGTGDIVIEDITFHWGRADDRRLLGGVLRALAVASGGRFDVLQSDETGFVLSPAHAERPSNPGRRIEVIGLAHYFAARGQAEMQLRRLEEVAAMIKMRRDAGLADEREFMDVTRNLEAAEQRYKMFAGSPDDLIAQVKEVTAIALRQLRAGSGEEASDEVLPEFRFHPGASLLIVSGSEEKLAIVRQVVGALTNH